MTQMSAQAYAEQLKKIYVRPGVSKINGIGLIALRAIPEGTRVLYSYYHSVSIDKRALLDAGAPKAVIDYFESIFDGTEKQLYAPTIHAPYLEPALINACFINHSNTPSGVIDDEGYVVSLRDLVVGEELSIDYADYLGASTSNGRWAMSRQWPASNAD
jgi:hypothetical protein